MQALLLAATLTTLVATPAAAGDAVPELRLDVDAFRLANGMRFLLVERPAARTVAAGWAVRSGSADDPPGASGMAHLLEHMLYKGSRTIGVRDARDEERYLAEEDALDTEIRQLRAAGAREGKIRKLEKRLARVVEEHRGLLRLGEFSTLYAEAGATGLDARTYNDLTLFHVDVPAEKLELWFWLESDRLMSPVFRELAAERRVIAEERRQRIESTPTGDAQQELQTAFWQPLPYARPTLGWPDELDAIDRRELRRHFTAHYTPDRLTAVLVGRFDRGRVRELAERYFGRLRPAPGSEPPSPPTREPFPPPRPGDARRHLGCACRPQVEAIWSTVPHGQPGAAALDVAAGLLNGRTGRLFRSLVLDQGVAFSAYALHHPKRRAGSFTLIAESRGGTPPPALLTAVDAELRRLAEAPIPAAELTKIKHQITTDAFRRLRDPTSLALQLLVYDALGDWHHLETWPRRVAAVTAADVRRAIRAYLVPDRRLVGFYQDRAETEPAP